MQIRQDVVDPLCVETAAPALGAMNFIALGQQELSQIRTVLSGDAGDQRLFSHFTLRLGSVPRQSGTPFIRGALSARVIDRNRATSVIRCSMVIGDCCRESLDGSSSSKTTIYFTARA